MQFLIMFDVISVLYLLFCEEFNIFIASLGFTPYILLYVASLGDNPGHQISILIHVKSSYIW